MRPKRTERVSSWSQNHDTEAGARAGVSVQVKCAPVSVSASASLPLYLSLIILIVTQLSHHSFVTLGGKSTLHTPRKRGGRKYGCHGHHTPHLKHTPKRKWRKNDHVDIITFPRGNSLSFRENSPRLLPPPPPSFFFLLSATSTTTT